MGLLGENVNQFQRTSPGAGLMQGLQAGSNFGLALRQQQMAETQQQQQVDEKQKVDDARMIGILLEASSKAQSVAQRQQYAQQANDLMSKYIPKLEGSKVDASDPNIDEFLSKGPKFKKLLIENPDAGLKDIDAFLTELGQKHAQGAVTEQQYKDVISGVSEAKKGAASELGSKIIRQDTATPLQAGLINQAVLGEAPYQTPEAKTGIEEYGKTQLPAGEVQQGLFSQMNRLDPAQANAIKTKEENVPGEYHAYAKAVFGKPWASLSSTDSQTVINKVEEAKRRETAARQDASMAGIDVEDLATSLKNGEVGLGQIKNTRGVAITNKVMSEVRKEYPHFNFIYADANAKYLTSTANQRIIGAVDASLPRVNMLAAQAEKLKNTPIPKWNSVLKTLSIETGDPTYTNFMSNRNAIVQEVNTALSGSSQSSDMRVQIELENLREARSPAQLAGAITNLREALIARKDASTQYIYPLEVVQGKKTKKQWDEEQKSLYRGKYEGKAQAPAQAGNTGQTMTFNPKTGAFE